LGRATHAVTEVATLQHDVATRSSGHRDGYERRNHVVSDSHGRRTGAQRECNESEDQPGETLHYVLLSAETKFCTGISSMYCFIAPPRRVQQFSQFQRPRAPWREYDTARARRYVDGV